MLTGTCGVFFFMTLQSVPPTIPGLTFIEIFEGTLGRIPKENVRWVRGKIKQIPCKIIE